MQQPSASIEHPQFTDLSTFALRLTQAYTSWHAPGTGEDVFSYFARTSRYTGDEHNLRATLIRERIVPSLKLAGASLTDVVHAQIYLTDTEDYSACNEVWSRHFGETGPTFSIIPCREHGLRSPSIAT